MQSASVRVAEMHTWIEFPDLDLDWILDRAAVEVDCSVHARARTRAGTCMLTVAARSSSGEVRAEGKP